MSRFRSASSAYWSTAWPTTLSSSEGSHGFTM